MTEVADVYQVVDASDHVEVRGASESEVSEAMQLLEAARRLRAKQVGLQRDDLVRALMIRDNSIVPPASLAQAQRLARGRDALLTTPVWTHETLCQVRGDEDVSATRTWVTRRRQRRAIFTVKHKGTTLIPAFQLTDEAEPRHELRPLLERLTDAGLSGWLLWTWLTSRSSLLSGEVPEKTARTDPKRAMRAAVRFASRRT